MQEFWVVMVRRVPPDSQDTQSMAPASRVLKIVTTASTLRAVITTVSLTDREVLNFRVSFSASRWNNISDMAITAYVLMFRHPVTGRHIP